MFPRLQTKEAPPARVASIVACHVRRRTYFVDENQTSERAHNPHIDRRNHVVLGSLSRINPFPREHDPIDRFLFESAKGETADTP
jgi:hypothetical protein